MIYSTFKRFLTGLVAISREVMQSGVVTLDYREGCCLQICSRDLQKVFWMTGQF